MAKEEMYHIALDDYEHGIIIRSLNDEKTDLMNEVKLSSGTIAKMSKGEPVSMLVLEKICDKLDCDFGDLIHYEKKEKVGDELE